MTKVVAKTDNPYLDFMMQAVPAGGGAVGHLLTRVIPQDIVKGFNHDGKGKFTVELKGKFKVVSPHVPDESKKLELNSKLVMTITKGSIVFEQGSVRYHKDSMSGSVTKFEVKGKGKEEQVYVTARVGVGIFKLAYTPDPIPISEFRDGLEEASLQVVPLDEAPAKDDKKEN